MVKTPNNYWIKEMGNGLIRLFILQIKLFICLKAATTHALFPVSVISLHHMVVTMRYDTSN